ncbi:uncharacterized protein RAG0_10493 [Rhynchosporium agropyri]|uniref:Uncharacterized protein n=1 Tax=Rhynchosporium agropyri TaxID=914238 RepID=A0A1E1L022_9HELO|nr:uncharacterized protein RAG0_10493 [Rhynchosporium agropyri]
MAKSLTVNAHLLTDAEVQKLQSSYPIEAAAIMTSREVTRKKVIDDRIGAEATAAFNKAVTDLDVEALTYQPGHEEKDEIVWQAEELARERIGSLAQYSFNASHERGYDEGYEAGLRAAGGVIGGSGASKRTQPSADSAAGGKKRSRATRRVINDDTDDEDSEADPRPKKFRKRANKIAAHDMEDADEDDEMNDDDNGAGDGEAGEVAEEDQDEDQSGDDEADSNNEQGGDNEDEDDQEVATPVIQRTASDNKISYQRAEFGCYRVTIKKAELA